MGGWMSHLCRTECRDPESTSGQDCMDDGEHGQTQGSTTANPDLNPQVQAVVQSSVLLDNQDLQLSIEERRWMAFGIALQKVVAQELRPFVENGVKQVYSNLITPPTIINQQVYPNHLKTLHSYNLDYRNINDNETHFKKDKTKYNFDVVDSIQFAKLFLPSHMTKFRAFDSSIDMSALLGIIINMNDSQCNEPKFRRLEPIARIVRQHRNEWGHVDFSFWTEPAYQNAMSDLESLLAGIYGSPAAIPCGVKSEFDKWNEIGVAENKDLLNKTTLELISTGTKALTTSQDDEVAKALDRINDKLQALLQDIEQKVINIESLVTDIHERIVTEPRDSDISSLVDTYQKDLFTFHEEALASMPQQLDPDVNTYVNLRVYTREDTFKVYEGQKDFETTLVTKGDYEVQLGNLFEAIESLQQPKKRTVAIIGVPGSGKTITSLHLLQSVINRTLFKQEIKFIYLVKFREINDYGEKISFRELVLSYHSPPLPKEKETQLWNHLINNQSQMMLILDGYDEMEGLGVRFKKSNTIKFTSLEDPQHAVILLHNLIAGNIFPGSKVIVTSRPQCTLQLSKHTYNGRLVNLDNLDDDQLKQMIENNFKDKPKLGQSLHKFILENTTLNGLCRVPLHVQSLIDYVKWKSQGQEDGEELPSLMPKTLSSLYTVIDLKMLRASDRTLGDSRHLTDEEVLSERKRFFKAAAKLASSGITASSGVSIDAKQLFTEADVKRQGLEISDLEGSMMTISQAMVPTTSGPVVKKFFSLGHLTQQEHMTSFDNAQKPEDDLVKLVNQNHGHLDTVIIMLVGALGDSMTNTLLQHLYPELTPEVCRHKAEVVLKAVWTSRRRYQLNFVGNREGELFALRCLFESQLPIPASLPPMADSLGRWNPPRRMSPIDITCAAHYLKHLPDNSIRLLKLGRNRRLLREILPDTQTSYTGLSVAMEDDVEVMEKVQTSLASTDHKVVDLELVSMEASPVESFLGGTYTSLQCLTLAGDPDKPSMDIGRLAQSLSQSKHLNTLVLDQFDLSMGHSEVAKNTTLRALKYLVLCRCEGLSHDSTIVEAIGKIVDLSQLQGLWMHGCEWRDITTQLLTKHLSESQYLLKFLHIWGPQDSISHQDMSRLSSTACNIKSLKSVHLHGASQADCAQLLTSLACLEDMYIDPGMAIDSRLCDLLSKSTHLSLLDLSSPSNFVISHNTLQQLCVSLKQNTSIKALVMKRCGLSSAHVTELEELLQVNRTIELVDISDNGLGAYNAANLIHNTMLVYLDMRGNETENIMGKDNGRRVADAVIDNSSMHGVGFGHFDRAASAGFVKRLCEAYPRHGPLHTVLIRDTIDNAKGALELSERLQQPNRVLVNQHIDMASLTGHRWASLPQHTRQYMVNTGIAHQLTLESV